MTDVAGPDTQEFVECNEKFLRQMFESPYGTSVGDAILERLEQGLRVTVIDEDGHRTILNERTDAVRLLVERYGWKGGGITSSAPSS